MSILAKNKARNALWEGCVDVCLHSSPVKCRFKHLLFSIISIRYTQFCYKNYFLITV